MVRCEVLKLFHPRPTSADITCPTVGFPTLPDMCKSCTKHEVLCLVKLLSNSLNTTWRMHESCRLSCVFGCEGALDELRHNIMCLVLLSSRVFAPLPPSSIESWIEPANIKLAAVFYELYNFLKHSDVHLFSVQKFLFVRGKLQQVLPFKAPIHISTKTNFLNVANIAMKAKHIDCAGPSAG